MRTPFRPIRSILWALLIVGILGGTVISWLGWSCRGAEGKNIGRLVHLGKALHIYAELHHGLMPSALSELYPEILDKPIPSRFNFRSEDSEVSYDWLYWPRLKLTALAPETIVAASPTVIAVRRGELVRLVLRRSGTVEYLPEADYERILLEQLRADRSRKFEPELEAANLSTPTPVPQPENSYARGNPDC